MSLNRSDRTGRTLLSGLVISLLAHFLVVGGLIGKWPGRDGAVVRVMNVDPTDEAQIRPVLGIEKSDAVTLTWLGFQKPTKHEAQKSEVEQAAMDTDPAGDPADTPTVTNPQEMAERASELAAAAVEAVAEARAEFAGAFDAAMKPMLKRLAAMGQARPVKPVEPAEPSPDAQTPAQEAIVAKPGAGLAIPSDKESIATAIKEASDYQPGKPVAAQGLDIKTVRPLWAVTTTLTAHPRNPVVWIAFGPDGKVTRAGFVPGQSTGATDVDEPLLSAVYAWTAKGKELKNLGKDEEIIISIRVLLR